MRTTVDVTAQHFDVHKVKLPRYSGRGTARVLVVLGSLYEDELEARQVFPDPKSAAVDNIMSIVAEKTPFEEVLFFPFDAFVGRMLWQDAWERFECLCDDFEPTHVLWTDIFTYKKFVTYCDPKARAPFYHTIRDHAAIQKAVLPLSTPRKVLIGGSVPLHDIVTDDPVFFKTLPNLAGYFIGCLTRLIAGGHPYPVRVSLETIKKKVVPIETREAFDVFYKVLCNARPDDPPAVDTETKSLGRYRNTILSIQIAVNDKVYFIPLHHPQSPVDEDTRAYFIDKLRDYFEFGTSPHLEFQNAKFDLTVMRIPQAPNSGGLGVRFYGHRIWDTMAGEFCLDENGKFLERYAEGGTNASYFALDAIALRYGCNAYHSLGVKKHMRSRMAEVPYDDFVLYACGDSLITKGIAASQRLVAKDAGFDDFENFMLNQFSDMHLAFTDLEHNGARIDRQYLYSLVGPASPINAILEEKRAAFYALPEVQEFGKSLAKGQATKSLFGEALRLFNMEKPDQMRRLFFEFLKMDPVNYTKTGQPSAGKLFLKANKDHPVAKVYKDFKDALTLRNNSINTVMQYMTESDDCRFDSRLRYSIGFIDVVTGRTSIRRPSLQNVPEHNPLAKYIKRQFICEVGNAIAKFDYNAHEIRMWGNVARDPQIAAAFYEGLKARSQQRVLMYRNRAAWQEWKQYLIDTVVEQDGKTKTLISRADWDYEQKQAHVRKAALSKDAKAIGLLDLFIKLKADIHIQNVKIIFGKDITKEDPLRSDVKSLIFGAIYGMSIPTLANNLKKSEEDTQKLYNLIFMQKFKVGGAYLQRTINRIRQTLYNKSPIGRLRHFWGYLHWKKSIHNAMDRRGPNSEVQGLASDIGCAAMRKTAQCLWHLFNKGPVGQAPKLPAKVTNYIHDSVEAEGPIATLPILLYLIEHAATTLIHKHYRTTYGFEMMVGLEVEFNVGFTKSALETWSFSYTDVPDILRETAKVLGRDTAPGFEQALAKCAHNAAIIEAIRLEELEASLKSAKPSEVMYLTPKTVRTYDFHF